MDKVTELKAWQQNVLLPWQRAAEAFNDKQAQQAARLRRHAPELKTMVALIMDGKAEAAGQLWNKLQFEPQLKKLENMGGDVLVLTLMNNTEQHVALDDLLADLTTLLED